ncbi:hypothetical protein [Aurantimonas sp. Leaf443]|uniref:hypothetical protein n=1 Tax=Aurantimonas sp. Leaf443 TaxID=1736378 RepID=UPI0006FA59C5|nr:hypothetical protein [Aurantimonas sp. Leaf443]KQT85436.1 hypothetical protein ASG48_09385 [Aurantimonas sp. Leaf443]
MGKFMGDDDILIGSLFEFLNLRFAPRLPPAPNAELLIDENFGGVEEMVALQREFAIFQKGRSFRESAAIMNLGGFWSPRARNRWYRLLEDLTSYPSNRGGLDGDAAIVEAIVDNLENGRALPILFGAHDSSDATQRLVLIGQERRAVVFIDEDYLTVSLPMRPREKRSGG